MEVLRWGIVGCGNISADFITALRLAERNHKVVAAASRSLEKAAEFVKNFQSGIQPYGSYAELFNDQNVGKLLYKFWPFSNQFFRHCLHWRSEYRPRFSDNSSVEFGQTCSV
jgi:hypothetical protein